MVSTVASETNSPNKDPPDEEEISSKMRAVEIHSDCEEGEEEIFIEDEALGDLLGDAKFSLVGRVLSQRRINLGGLKKTFEPLWGSPEGFDVEEIVKGVFHFSFDKEKDRDRVLSGRPWFFKNQLLVLSSWDLTEGLESANLNFSPLWLQLWDIPPRFCSEKVVRGICGKLGEVLEVRLSQRATEAGRFARVKVMFDVRKALLKTLKANLGSLGSFVATLRYENMPFMCFYCGLLGHDNESCDKRIEDIRSDALKKDPFGTWMKAKSLEELWAPQISPKIKFLQKKEQADNSRKLSGDCIRGPTAHPSSPVKCSEGGKSLVSLGRAAEESLENCTQMAPISGKELIADVGKSLALEIAEKEKELNIFEKRAGSTQSNHSGLVPDQVTASNPTPTSQNPKPPFISGNEEEEAQLSRLLEAHASIRSSPSSKKEIKAISKHLSPAQDEVKDINNPPSAENFQIEESAACPKLTDSAIPKARVRKKTQVAVVEAKESKKWKRLARSKGFIYGAEDGDVESTADGKQKRRYEFLNGNNDILDIDMVEAVDSKKSKKQNLTDSDRVEVASPEWPQPTQ